MKELDDLRDALKALESYRIRNIDPPHLVYGYQMTPDERNRIVLAFNALKAAINAAS